MQIILFVAYFLVGCLLSLPYTFLASGNLDNLLYTAWLLPGATVCLYVLYMVDRKWGNRLNKRAGPVFWSALAYCCLPILMNGASLLLRTMGYEAAGQFAFKWRYGSLVVVATAMYVCAVIVSEVKGRRQRMRGNIPPASPV